MGFRHNGSAKKKRESELSEVREVIAEFVKPPRKGGLITKEDLERAEREHVHDMANLQVFLRWIALGGMMRGISVTEAATLPVTMLRDFALFSRVYSDAKDAQDRVDKITSPPRVEKRRR